VSWKRNFKPGETLVLKGVPFLVANVGRRGLALRRKPSPSVAEMKAQFLRGDEVVCRPAGRRVRVVADV
jgi:hypothetical protein